MRSQNSVIDCCPLGNDTFPKELKRHTVFDGVGPAAVRDMLARLRAQSQDKEDVHVPFDDLLTEALESVPKQKLEMANLSKLSRPDIKALVEAMAYERAAISDSGEMYWVWFLLVTTLLCCNCL